MKKHTIIKFAALLLAVGAVAFTIDDKKASAKKTDDKKVATAKTKKKSVCCESGIPDRFAAAGAKVLKKEKAPATH